MTQKQKQKNYFDFASNQFPLRQLLRPLFSQKLEMEHLLRFIPQSERTKILDFGSGSGRLSLYLAEKKFNVISYDISQKSLSRLYKYYLRAKKTGWGSVLVTSRLNFHKKVDSVVGADVLHHVSLPAELVNIYQLIKPGGTVAFSEPNALSPFWYLYHFFHRTPWHIESGLLNCFPGKLTSYFKLAGFEQLKISPHGVFPTRIFNGFPLLCRINAFFLPRVSVLGAFSYRLIISARKPLLQKLHKS